MWLTCSSDSCNGNGQQMNWTKWTFPLPPIATDYDKKLIALAEEIKPSMLVIKSVDYKNASCKTVQKINKDGLSTLKNIISYSRKEDRQRRPFENRHIPLIDRLQDFINNLQFTIKTNLQLHLQQQRMGRKLLSCSTIKNFTSQ